MVYLNQISHTNLFKKCPANGMQNGDEAHDSQIVRAKENPKVSHGGPSQRQASDTSPSMNVLGQRHH